MGLEFDMSVLLSKMEELEKKVQKDITDKALREGAKILLDEQLENVPRDTGELADSLIIGKITGRGANRKIMVGIDPAKAEKVRYGYYQEHGTATMLGKKWMKKSWVKSNKKARETIGKSLAENIGDKKI